MHNLGLTGISDETFYWFRTAFALILQNDMIKPAIQGVLNVLKACAKAKTVKRVVLTSSAAAVSINNIQETGLVMDEKNWTDVEFLTAVKPPTWVKSVGHRMQI